MTGTTTLSNGMEVKNVNKISSNLCRTMLAAYDCAEQSYVLGINAWETWNKYYTKQNLVGLNNSKIKDILAISTFSFKANIKDYNEMYKDMANLENFLQVTPLFRIQFSIENKIYINTIKKNKNQYIFELDNNAYKKYYILLKMLFAIL